MLWAAALAAHAISVIARHHSQVRDSFVAAGAVPALVALLHHVDWLPTDWSGQLSQGSLLRTFASPRNFTNQPAIAATEALYVLAEGQPATCDAIVRANAIAPLFGLASTSCRANHLGQHDR